VFNVLLQALDDGRMTDGQGRTVDFKNTVIIMTSNLGSHKMQAMEDADPAVMKLAVMAEVRAHFRPEFINRIDEIVVFHGLDEKNIGAIAKIQLAILEQRLAHGHDADGDGSGAAENRRSRLRSCVRARPLKRAIQQQIENPLSKLILQGRFGPKDTIRVDVSNGELSFN
jgi:ATP-dependent Clp protease ATP-binding subunit ClpB